MRLVEAAVKSFARHETFHPRYGWFRKAYAFVEKDPRVFLRRDATVEIGVGKNMVRAIRFWGLAAKLIKEDKKSPSKRAPNLIPTDLGHRLFGNAGWDPYMEDPGTLWLLHWMLLAPLSRLPVWWLAFHEFHAVEFTDDDLQAAINMQLDAAEWTKPHPSSIKKDVSALLRTYASPDYSKRKRTGIDDILDCPLRELNLIGRSATTDGYRFTLGEKPTLPSAILTYTTLDYISRTKTGGNTITLSRLAREPGAPGRAFKLTEGDLLAGLEPAVGRTDKLDLVRTTAGSQLSWAEEPRQVANKVLDAYYREPAATCQIGMKRNKLMHPAVASLP